METTARSTGGQKGVAVQGNMEGTQPRITFIIRRQGIHMSLERLDADGLVVDTVVPGRSHHIIAVTYHHCFWPRPPMSIVITHPTNLENKVTGHSTLKGVT